MSIFSRLRLAETSPRPDTTERGSNAVSWQWSGRSRLRDPEYKYELQGRQGGKIYQRMRFSDPHIAGLRRAQNLPLLRASAAIEPAEAKNPDAEAKADLVERLLLKDSPWRAFLADTCLAMDYGFAAFEIVWRIEDGEARFRLALRPADSIAADDIEVKDGAVARVIQRPDTGGEFEIPGEKLVWFCHEKEGDNFLGRPILRAMYKPWKIKEELEVELPELMRKLGGIPDITTQGEPDVAIAAELDAAAEGFGVQAGGYFRHDDTVTVQLLTGSAQVKDVLDAIKERNTEITSVCQAQVFDLGNAQNGSRALGSTLSDLFMHSVQAMASYREDILNAKGGLIHQLVSYNFPNDDNLPALRFGNVQQADMAAFALALTNLQKAFGSLDEETQEWARQQLNMPEGTTTQVTVPPAPPIPEKAPPAPAANNQQDKGADDAGGAPTGTDNSAQASERHSHGLKLGENRAPRGVECYVQLAEIDQRFNDAKTAIKDATQRTRDRLIGILVDRARAAQGKGDLAKFTSATPPMVDAVRDAIKTVLADYFAAGRAQVADELQRQREGRPVVQEAVQARQEGQRITAAEPPKKAPPLPNPDDAMDEAADVAARALAAQTQAAVAAAVMRASAGVPLDPGAISEMATRESDAAALRLAGAVSDLMQLGRATEAADQATDIEDAVYSAILDGATCEACKGMDGEVTTDLDEASTWTPNPGCDGLEKCRCLTIYELKQGATE